MSDSTSGDVVTGEAVVLDLRLARFASRSLALAIDLAVQLGLLLVGIFVVAGALALVDDSLGAAIGLVFSLLVVVGYPVAWETLTRGRSLGKMALGLRVVREDGGPIRFRQAFVRGLMSVVEIWLTFGVVALVTSLASTQGRRLGDFLAGTVVIHERVPVRATAVAAMPPGLAGWAQGLDLSRVPDALALQARQFLGRAHELSPQVREQMGSAIARALAAVVAPAPPPGVPAWAFVAAVLAERRRRETLRLAAGGGWGETPTPSTPPPPAGPPAAPPAGSSHGSTGDRPFAPPS
ncbi:MAG: RDD family protein [Sporichthyaceae bacterium]